MRRLSIVLLSIVWALSLSAQTIVRRPSWVSVLPKAPANANYYYRMTCGEARTYQEAYAKAFATAILESSWKLGVAVDVNSTQQSLEANITESINVQSHSVRIPLNKVCEYTEDLTTAMGIRVYVLWQVARYGNVAPNFDDFTDCR